MSTAFWPTTFGIDRGDCRSRLFLSSEDTHDAPFGNAMAQGLATGVSGYLSYQGKPIAAFVYSEDQPTSPEGMDLRQMWDGLWNQGLASVLIFHRPHKVEVYSLIPPTDDLSKEDIVPVEAVELAVLGLEAFNSRCKDLIWKLQDGRYYEENSAHFVEENRVDRKLLANMEAVSRKLKNLGLSVHQARALLLQTLFIAYLEDRDILQEADFLKLTGYAPTLEAVLEKHDVHAFQALFDGLSKKFNGDVFSSPCSFAGKEEIRLTPEHLTILLEFRGGKIDSRTSQRSFLPLYDFKFIPVELLSAIYDKFQQPEAQRATGSYFTPAYLAQVCLDLAWDHVPPESASSADFHVLDPACGSAVFLVCAFQRLVGLLQSPSSKVNWDTLLSVLDRLHGLDINEDALRVGVISLYIALLERADPPSITEHMAKGRLLPQLLGKTMRVGDFFDDSLNDSQAYGLILGNPPWISRKKTVTEKIKAWCDVNGYDMPGNGSVWGFIWKAGHMLRKDGVAALLVDAKALFNLQAEKVRRRLFAEYQVPLIVNFADACFQFFEGAEAPAALFVLRPRQEYENWGLASTTYWSPKANPVFSANHRVLLSPDDRAVIKQWRLAQDTSVLKNHRWGRSRDITLLHELKRFSPLAERMAEFKDWKRTRRPDVDWWIGQGFKPHGKGTPPTGSIRGLMEHPFLGADTKFRWILPHISSKNVTTGNVHRPGISKPIIEGLFSPPMILLKQGVDRKTGLLQCAYTEQRASFQHSIQAIVSLKGDEDAATFKVLAAVLNSRFAAWFFLHTSTVQGVERDKVLQNDILAMPFPLPKASDDPQAGDEIVAAMDLIALERAKQDKIDQEPLRGRIEPDRAWEDHLNELVYRYYGLTRHERRIVEDSFRWIQPSIQPRKNARPVIWEAPRKKMLEEYAAFLLEGLAANYRQGAGFSVSIFTGHRGLVVAELCRDESDDIRDEIRVETAEEELSLRLDMLQQEWPGEIAQGVHHVLQLTFARGNKLYLVKPNRIRHWMPSVALCDVDRIVAELNAVKLGKISA